MARWQPDAPGRLAAAALDLFEERGYENTTVIGIAERAGLTKSTFFRHFPDKREVLFGESAMTGLLAGAIAAAPAAAGPLEAVAHALDVLGREVFADDRREFSARRQAVLEANPELREREARKRIGLVDAMTEALEHRGVPGRTARVAAKLGALAWEIAHDEWIATNGEDFASLVRQVLAEVREVSAAC
ncbi:TetR/AcrR family transcriptional regulator [Amycolatopsis rubida]|uniref:TetR/AcrR family transcriptional regulator n=1 Tax=Amycolatopsis rubida TaxID=112413 RepID=A0ABX0BQN3_9PSEU|nr:MULTISPECIES: TetR/AcrR family transcriptional regulator [Amycolatopsis]MYW91736.1 TetR family transcriptional regulator [Amycolatopsis rubida]NEC56720.1 TetR/AcrR family transcriptional regulator [Amycolatopsis rubida]OAP20736.1 Bacterial regulatory protein, tetR family [Amycolatopsis sp. M39]